MADLTEEDKERYFYFKSSGKKYASNGNIERAITKFKQAFEIHPSEKINKKIKKLEEYLVEQENSEGNDPGLVDMGNGFSLFRQLYETLYDYQRKGVLWMWDLHKRKKGGILGDDMGLGKTIQVIAFLTGLIDMGESKAALIIMPVSLLTVWEKEFEKWAPGMLVELFHGGNKLQRERSLSRVQRRGGALLMSYGMLSNNATLLNRADGRNFVWDYVILDEGHKIKNPTKTTKAAHEVEAHHRLVLTGTPIQNNLKELWALYDFCHQGTLLGTLTTFKMQYETPINRGREKDATSMQRKLGMDIAENLRIRIAPYFLRRTKAEVQDHKENIDPSRKLPAKNDLIIWLYLSESQIQVYKDFLELDHVKSLLMTTKSPLVELTVLKKLCDHPRLLSQRACMQLGLDGSMTEEQLQDALEDNATASSSIDVPDELLCRESGKLNILIILLENLRQEGHRTLVFSMSRKMLDIINKILLNRKWRVLRLDGTVRKMSDRDACVKKFQSDANYPVLLLTTQVGGVGLTLTAADRVIIYDPSWNPATDAQAVDRAYRIGQKKNVVVYRLLTCGTIEEKIYRRQIFKDSIMRQAVGGTKNKDPHRYFTRFELRDLFKLDNPNHSSTQVQLEAMHSKQRKESTELDSHLAFLYSLNIFGVSHHDLMFQDVHPNYDQPPDEGAVGESHAYIQQRVLQAQRAMETESQMIEKTIEGIFAKPYSLPLKVPKASKPIVHHREGDMDFDDYDEVLISDDDETDTKTLQLEKSIIDILAKSLDKSTLEGVQELEIEGVQELEMEGVQELEELEMTNLYPELSSHVSEITENLSRELFSSPEQKPNNHSDFSDSVSPGNEKSEVLAMDSFAESPVQKKKENETDTSVGIHMVSSDDDDDDNNPDIIVETDEDSSPVIAEQKLKRRSIASRLSAVYNIGTISSDDEDLPALS